MTTKEYYNYVEEMKALASKYFPLEWVEGCGYLSSKYGVLKITHSMYDLPENIKPTVTSAKCPYVLIGQDLKFDGGFYRIDNIVVCDEHKNKLDQWDLYLAFSAVTEKDKIINQLEFLSKKLKQLHCEIKIKKLEEDFK